MSPSDVPSVSAVPSSSPSDRPSGSAIPSVAPSDSPSVSVSPSGRPSDVPSVSSSPSSSPSDVPSLSVGPSSSPSDVPSLSASPSFHPSAPPSVSSIPSREPSSLPSESILPSEVPSAGPSFSSAPSASPSRTCKNVLIDFEEDGSGATLLAGAYVKYEWLDDYGIVVTASSAGTGYTPDDRPRLFDTSNPGPNDDNGDVDLGSPNQLCNSGGPGVGNGGVPGSQGENCVPQGLVLVIQESNKLQWDDDRDGGVITFSFDHPVDEVFEIGLMDIDDNETRIEVTFEEGPSQIIAVNGLGNNSVQSVTLNVLAATSVRVIFAESGAVTHLYLCVDEVPSDPPALSPLTPRPSASPSTSPLPSSAPSDFPVFLAPPVAATSIPSQFPSNSPSEACIESVVVATDDFEAYSTVTDATNAGWTNAKLDQDQLFTKILGRFNRFDDDPQRTFAGVPVDAAYVQVELDFLEIDDWEGRDSFCIFIDGDLIDLGTFKQEVDEGARTGVSALGISWSSSSTNPPQHIGFNAHRVDQIHHFVARVPTSFYADGQLTLRFTTKNVSTLNYESSGVDNIKITAFFECSECVDSVVVVEEDFEEYTSEAEVVSSGWVNGKLETADTPFTKFLGRYDKDADSAANDPYKVYQVPTGADYLLVELDFYEIDSWDGQDCVYIYVNNQEIDLLIYNYIVDEGYKSGVTTNGIAWVIDSKANPPGHIGFNPSFVDQIHHLRARVPSYLVVTGELKLRFATRIDGDRTNESSGFDNIKITAFYDCGVCLPSEVVAFEDFEDSSLTGWVNGRLDFDSGLTKFLGRYDSDDEHDSEDPVKYYFVPQDASHLTVEVDFYEIDNWEHPDCIYVYVGGQTLGLGYFKRSDDEGLKTGTAGTITWQSESQGAPAHIGFNTQYKDQVHHIIATVPPEHFANGVLRLGFGTRVEGVGKSAGYDNIKITAYRDCGPCLPEQVLKFEDFEDYSLAGWTNGKLDMHPGFTTFLGRYDDNNFRSADDPSKRYTVPPSASSVRVEFDFYEIDQWAGADYLYVYINAEELNLGVFNYNVDEGLKTGSSPSGITWQSLSGGTPTHIGFGSVNDQIHRVTATVPSSLLSAGTLELRFGTRLSGGMEVNSSGFDNIRVTALYSCESPSSLPSATPSFNPSMGPSAIPSMDPSFEPSMLPTAAPSEACIESVVVATDDFEAYSTVTDATNAGWTNAKLDQDQLFTKILGRFNRFDDDPQRTFAGVPVDAAYVQVELDFLEIDDWEGRDSFCIFIDGDLIDLGTFKQEVDEGARTGVSALGISWSSSSTNPPQHIGFNAHRVDQIHHFVARVPTSFYADGQLTLRFTTKNVSTLNYESSGVDNIKITAFFECSECVDSVVVVEEDFEEYTSEAEVVSSGWVNGKLETADTPFTKFLGRYDKDADSAANDPYKVYQVPTGADYLLVELDFYEIDSWDGQDCVYIYVNNQEIDLLIYNYIVDEGYKSGVTTNGIAWVIDSKANPPGHIGFNPSFVDQIHHLRARVPSYLVVTGELKLRFATRIDGDRTNESSGFDNIKITAFYDCGVCLPSEVVAFEDFEDSSLTGWVNGRLDFDSGLTKFLGRYDSDDEHDSEDPVKYYFVPQDASHLTVEVDFYEIDNWEHPDCIYVYVGGQTLGLGYFKRSDDEGLKTGTAGTITWQSESQGAPAHIGFNTQYKDQVHHIIATVPPEHFANGVLRLGFGTRVEGVGKSAGYDNIKITAYRDCGPCLPEQVLKFEDFEDYSLAGWTNGKLDMHPGFTTFLGRYDDNNFRSADDPSKRYTVPPSASSVRVEFDFYEIDQWAGADYLYVYINAEELNLGVFNYNVDEGLKTGSSPSGITWQSLSGGTPTHIGFGSVNDQIHRVTATVPSSLLSAGTLELRFGTRLSGGMEVNSSGFDNIRVTALYDCNTEPIDDPCPNCVVIDFETAGDGTALDSSHYVKYEWYDAYGMTVTAKALNGGFTPDGKARIFDSSNPGTNDENGDPDLGSPNQNCSGGGPGGGSAAGAGTPYANCDSLENILIIQESDKAFADDNAGGGSLTFDFEHPVRIEHVGLLDIDEEGDSIEVYMDNGSSVNIGYPTTGQNTLQNVVINRNDVVKIVVNFKGSGAVTELAVCFDCDKPSGCKAVESQFTTSCSEGSFGVENVDIISTAPDASTVTFSLQHSSAFGTLNPIGVWFDNPNELESSDFCWQGSNVAPETPYDTFTAQCTDGWATINISGGDGATNKFQQFLDVIEPFCQASVDLPDFNPQKRCYWQLRIPCRCDEAPSRDNTRLLLQPSIEEPSTKTECSEDSKSVDISRVPVDKCSAPDKYNPIEIISQDTDTITFSLSQVWKGCDLSRIFQGRKLASLATDYVATNGELTCSRFDSLSCGEISTFTAVCQDGATVVDLYTYDSDGRLFSQTDDAPIVVPTACGVEGDPTNMCHYRYVLKCEPSKCDKPVESRRLRKETFKWF